MNPNETKVCPGCGNTFECKPGNITQCQCFGMKFTAEEKAFIEHRYNDCLCRSCLEKPDSYRVKNRVELFKEKFIYCR